MSIPGLSLRGHFSRPVYEIHMELDPLGQSHARSNLHGEWLGWHRSKPQAEVVGHRLRVQLFNLMQCDIRGFKSAEENIENGRPVDNRPTACPQTQCGGAAIASSVGIQDLGRSWKILGRSYRHSRSIAEALQKHCKHIGEPPRATHQETCEVLRSVLHQMTIGEQYPSCTILHPSFVPPNVPMEAPMWDETTLSIP